VLDLGCGNGWLANSIAATTDSSVVGLDLNRYELQQARRLFAQRTSLSWIVTDIFSAPFRDAAFDVVVIASAIQYFADLPGTLRKLVPFLKAQGEIHILDSPSIPSTSCPRLRNEAASTTPVSAFRRWLPITITTPLPDWRSTTLHGSMFRSGRTLTGPR
jgi:ubiquinone/menaquinone biosynthesis C-methylase UbiE